MHALYRAGAVTTEEMVYEMTLVADRMRRDRERTDRLLEQVRQLMLDELGCAPPRPRPELRLVGNGIELGPDDRGEQ
jgi:hypothetical protein